MQFWRTSAWGGLLAGLWCGTAAAHTFGRVYSLPVPVWMYLYGAAAALALSFLLIAWFATKGERQAAGGSRELGDSALLRLAWRLRLMRCLQGLSLGGLLLAIATGLWGTVNPYGNWSMTWFWVLFVLGLAYFTALGGNLYPWINPWRLLCAGLGRLWRRYPQGLLRYPRGLDHWPALVLYMGFIWIELHAELGTGGLGGLLVGYSVLNLVGVGLIGARDWFRYVEFFGLFFRLIGQMAPLAWARGGRLQLRAPCAGLIGQRAESFAVLLFILFMLSSTAFDGLRYTTPWVRLFWVDLYAWLQPWVGRDPVAAYRLMKPLYEIWSSAILLLSPLLYLAVYLAFIAMVRGITRSALPVGELALRFAPSLLPIALVYHVAHYYTLFITQGIKIIGLASDPFGWRWNLFGTTHWWRSNWVPEPEIIWHSQLALIVGGHIVGVYIAHVTALELFGDRRRAALSQLPMLGLMMLFTAFGLWILGQPISSG